MKCVTVRRPILFDQIVKLLFGKIVQAEVMLTCDLALTFVLKEAV